MSLINFLSATFLICCWDEEELAKEIKNIPPEAHHIEIYSICPICDEYPFAVYYQLEDEYLSQYKLRANN